MISNRLRSAAASNAAALGSDGYADVIDGLTGGGEPVDPGSIPPPVYDLTWPVTDVVVGGAVSKVLGVLYESDITLESLNGLVDDKLGGDGGVLPNVDASLAEGVPIVGLRQSTSVSTHDAGHFSPDATEVVALNNPVVWYDSLIVTTGAVAAVMPNRGLSLSGAPTLLDSASDALADPFGAMPNVNGTLVEDFPILDLTKTTQLWTRDADGNLAPGVSYTVDLGSASYTLNTGDLLQPVTDVIYGPSIGFYEQLQSVTNGIPIVGDLVREGLPILGGVPGADLLAPVTGVIGGIGGDGSVLPNVFGTLVEEFPVVGLTKTTQLWTQDADGNFAPGASYTIDLANPNVSYTLSTADPLGIVGDLTSQGLPIPDVPTLLGSVNDALADPFSAVPNVYGTLVEDFPIVDLTKTTQLWTQDADGNLAPGASYTVDLGSASYTVSTADPLGIVGDLTRQGLPIPDSGVLQPVTDLAGGALNDCACGLVETAVNTVQTIAFGGNTGPLPSSTDLLGESVAVPVTSTLQGSGGAITPLAPLTNTLNSLFV